MKVSYKRNVEFKLLGVKLFEIKTNLIEHSTDENSEDDNFYIDLNTAIMNKGKEK